MAYTALSCNEPYLSIEDIIRLVVLTKNDEHALRVVYV